MAHKTPSPVLINVRTGFAVAATFENQFKIKCYELHQRWDIKVASIVAKGVNAEFCTTQISLDCLPDVIEALQEALFVLSKLP